MLVTAEAGPSLAPPLLPALPLRGNSLRQAMVLPTSWVQCQAPMGQVSWGTHRLQVCGGCRFPPIQCEGFLCSVVFLTPKGGGVPGGNQGRYRGWPSSCSSVCCGPSRAAGAWGSSSAHSRPCLWHPWGLGTCVFGLHPAVLRAPLEGVGRWRVPEGVRVWEQGPGCPAGRRLWGGQG